MNDIDLSSIDNWEPIGTYSGTGNQFTGTFDGNGHVIKNLKIDRSDERYIGLFGSTNGATIKNVGLENVDIKGDSSVGALIGYSYYQSIISNCYCNGNVSGKADTGGLIGLCEINNTISNCYYNGNVSGKFDTGGLIGFSDKGNTISNCYCNGNVSGKAGTGGLIGWNSTNTTISNAYTTCNVKGNERTGLITGYTSGKITNVWADKNDLTISAFGEIGSSTITNSGAVSHEEFTSHEFWDKQNLDSDIWEMSCHIPPILKNIGGFQGNWYFRESSNEFRFQVGSGSDPSANALFVNTGLNLGAMNIDLSTVEGCLDASNCAKAALDAVAKRTADIGIEQSRLETISNVNNTQIENLSAAYSTVTEADVAEEVARYTKAQIMAQAASSLITQTQNFQANLLMRMISSLG